MRQNTKKIVFVSQGFIDYDCFYAAFLDFNFIRHLEPHKLLD